MMRKWFKNLPTPAQTGASPVTGERSRDGVEEY
jgi:hypothetical protein